MPCTAHTRRPAMHVLEEELSAWVYRTTRRLSDYRIYRRTVSELSDLSVRELSDLGLHRSEIRQVAHETVYGRRP